MNVKWTLAAAACLVVSCQHQTTDDKHAHSGDHVEHGKHGKHAASQPGHHHAFDDAEKWAKRFESTDRDAWQMPQLVVAALKLNPNMRVADIGSATGYFPVRIAKAVPQGRVWGVDIEPDMVRYLNQRARKEGLNNLFSVLGHPDDALIPEPVDRVLVVNTYHHISDRTAYFTKIKASLRPAAQLAVVDFVKGELPFGPPDAMKLAPAEVEAELKAAGYSLVKSIDGLKHQYMLIFAVAE